MSVPVSTNPIENAIENLRAGLKEREAATKNARKWKTLDVINRAESLLKVYDATVYAISLGEDVDINRVMYGKGGE